MRAQISLLLASTMMLASAFIVPARAADIKNVVIVHGALADGSGWRKVFDLLTAKGYKVTDRAAADDVAAGRC